MEAEITPEPTEEEREAVFAAIARLNGRHAEPPAWWQAGVREATDEDETP